jgi:hypothetical protein
VSETKAGTDLDLFFLFGEDAGVAGKTLVVTLTSGVVASNIVGAVFVEVEVNSPPLVA